MGEKIRNLVSRIMKSKMLLIACAAVLVVVIAVVAISAAVSSSPLNQVKKAVEKSADSAMKNETFAQIQTLATGGSIELSGNLEKLTEQLTGLPLDIAASAKLYVNGAKGAMAAEAAVEMEGESLLDGTFYFDKNKVALACAALLGDTAYGVDLGKLGENFADSAFGEDGAYSLGISDDELTEMLAMLEKQEDMSRDAVKIAEDAIEMLTKQVKKNAKITKDKGDIKFDGKEVKTNEIKIKLDGKGLFAIAQETVKYLEDEKAIEKFIKEYADILAAQSGYDADELLDAYKDAIEDASDSLDDLEDELEEVEVELVISISKSSKEIAALELVVENDNYQLVEIKASCGPTWKAMTEFTLEIDPGYDAIEIAYKVEEDSKEEFTATLEILEDDTLQLMAGEFSWEKKDGDFKATLYIDGEEFVLRGIMTKKSKTTTFVLESITVDEQKIKLGDLTLTLKASDKMPSIGKYTDIMTMDEDEIEDILEDIQDAVKELGSGLLG